MFWVFFGFEILWKNLVHLFFELFIYVSFIFTIIQGLQYIYALIAPRALKTT